MNDKIKILAVIAILAIVLNLGGLGAMFDNAKDGTNYLIPPDATYNIGEDILFGIKTGASSADFKESSFYNSDGIRSEDFMALSAVETETVEVFIGRTKIAPNVEPVKNILTYSAPSYQSATNVKINAVQHTQGLNWAHESQTTCPHTNIFVPATNGENLFALNEPLVNYRIEQDFSAGNYSLTIRWKGANQFGGVSSCNNGRNLININDYRMYSPDLYSKTYNIEILGDVVVPPIENGTTPPPPADEGFDFMTIAIIIAILAVFGFMAYGKR